MAGQQFWIREGPQRRPKVRRPTWLVAAEARRRHTHDRALLLAHAYFTAQHGRIAVETIGPERMAHHGGAIGRRNFVIGGGEQPAKRRRKAQHLKIVAQNQAAAHVSRRRAIERNLQIRLIRYGENRGERLLAAAQLFKKRVEKHIALSLKLRLQNHEAFRVGDGKRAQHHRVQHAEHSRGRADAQRHRQNRDHRKSRTLPHSAKSVARILRYLFESHPSPHLSHLLLLVYNFIQV